MSGGECLDGMPKPVLVTYGWPREHFANGVVSYTSEITSGMHRIGARPRVAAFSVTGSEAEFVSQVPAWCDSHSRAFRSACAVVSRVCPHLLRFRWRGDPLLAELRRLQADAGVDICEIEEAHGTASYLALRSPIPVVVRLHGPWFLNGVALGVEQDRSFWRRVRDEGKSIASAHGVTAPSQSVLDAVRSHFGLPLETAEVIPNPVRLPASWERWSASTCEKGRILFVGRFDRHKGGDVVIDALAKLRAFKSHCSLSFAGPDSGLVREDRGRTSLKEYISARASELLSDGSVQILGVQSSERLAQLRRQANVTVVCSRYENFPMAALEAMALGCPVVGTDIGGIPEIIQHERNGLLCRPGDPDDLAEKILVLLRNPELTARLGAQAALDVRERYHPDRIARQTLSFYRRTIDAFQSRSNGRLRTPTS